MRSLGTSSSINRSVTPRNQTFPQKLQRLFKLLQTKSLVLFKKFKKTLWIGTTGLIFLAVPIYFGVQFDLNAEMQKILRSSEMSGMPQQGF